MKDEFIVNCRKLILDTLGTKRNSKDIEKALISADVEYIKSDISAHRGTFLFIKEKDIEKFTNYLKLSKTEKYERTCNVKYGVNNISQIQSVIDKKRKTFDKNRNFHKKPEPRKQLSQRALRRMKISQDYPNQYDKNIDLLCSKVSSIFNLSTATIKNYCEFLGINIIEKYQGVRKVYVITNDDFNIIKNWINENPNKNDRMIMISENTMMKLYGVKHALQSEQFLTKSMNTCESHYGVRHPAQSEEVQETWKKTNLEIYGVENPSQAQSVKDKKAETTMEHFGVENPFQAQEIIEMSKETKLEKYGTLTVVAHYRYNNIGFHSKEEVYFYIYHHDILKDDITRGEIFRYYVGDVPHDYECDFLVNGENVEIKGRHLINRKTMILQSFPDKIPQYEKTQCLRDNNVKIYIDNDEEIIRISKIVEETFPNLVKSCRIKKDKKDKKKKVVEVKSSYDTANTIFEM